MDELDKMLYSELKREEAPSEFRSVIQNCLKDKKLKKKIKYYSLIKIITTSCASLLLTAGIVYAGTVAIEKIWKQPEKVVGYVEDNTITEEERKNVMSEENARKKVEEILEKFGHKTEKIQSIKIERNAINYKLEWCVETDNKTSIIFDANGGKGIYVFFDSIFDKNIENYRTTKEEAEQMARELCKRYGYDLNEYTHVKVDSNMELLEKESYIWYVDFYKEYDNLVDEYNGIKIGFVPEINDIYYFVVLDEKYENNSVEITEQQAKKIALEEEKKTEIKYEVKSSEAKLSIVSMNGEAYARTIDYQQFCKERSTTNYPIEKQIEYRTGRRIRKVWKVTIEYNVPNEEIFKDSFNNQDLGYIYYIDSTTGEIIGGEDYNKPIIIKN